MKSSFYLISIFLLFFMFMNGVLLTIIANQRFIGTALIVISLSLAIILAMIQKNNGKRKSEKDSSAARKKKANAGKT